MLESLELSGVLRLLEHTNADFVVRLFNGPLDSVVATMAGSVAEALVDRQIAGLVKHGTDTIQERQMARFRVVLEAFGYFFGGFGAISHGFQRFSKVFGGGEAAGSCAGRLGEGGRRVGARPAGVRSLGMLEIL